MYSMKQQLSYIRNRINKDNYANKNYEIACTYIKMIELFIKDREAGEENYYEINMCPEKSPNLDSYIICTTKAHNDYGIQIKSGNIYDSTVKERIFYSQYKYSLNPDHFILLTWNKFTIYDGFHSIDEVEDESILDILEYIERKKECYEEGYSFLTECLDTLVRYTKWKQDANWIVLSRIQSDMLNKKEYEENIGGLLFSF